MPVQHRAASSLPSSLLITPPSRTRRRPAGSGDPGVGGVPRGPPQDFLGTRAGVGTTAWWGVVTSVLTAAGSWTRDNGWSTWGPKTVDSCVVVHQQVRDPQTSKGYLRLTTCQQTTLRNIKHPLLFFFTFFNFFQTFINKKNLRIAIKTIYILKNGEISLLGLSPHNRDIILPVHNY